MIRLINSPFEVLSFFIVTSLIHSHKQIHHKQTFTRTGIPKQKNSNEKTRKYQLCVVPKQLSNKLQAIIGSNGLSDYFLPLQAKLLPLKANFYSFPRDGKASFKEKMPTINNFVWNCDAKWIYGSGICVQLW